MEVLVEFERAYAGPTPDAVWIIDSPENRSWFKEQSENVDSNSAIFDEDSDTLTVLENVFDHHPGWTEIVVRGASLTREIENAVLSDAAVASRSEKEFRLARR